MSLMKFPGADENYLATIVEIKNLRKHSNADRLQCTEVFGSNVIVGLDTALGDICVFFPLECQISSEFLSYTNSFSNPAMNADGVTKGFFDKNGRVRAIKLRGERSEGYLIPLTSLVSFARDVLSVDLSSVSSGEVGSDFDHVGNHRFVKKYIIPVRTSGSGTEGKKKKNFSSAIFPLQFNFHADTTKLEKNMHEIFPGSIISITNKMHGTSFVVANLLLKRNLNPFARFLRLLRLPINEWKYGTVYSSRKVIKGCGNVRLGKNDYYTGDLWGTVAREIEHLIPEGFSVYGEIVGKIRSGGDIQKGYDYGYSGTEHGIYVYRVTFTTTSGDVFDLSHHQMINFCQARGFLTPEVYFHGKASEIMEMHPYTLDEWREILFTTLKDQYLEVKCHLCKNDVWAEGVVIRLDNGSAWKAFKMKSFNFLRHETKMLDAGLDSDAGGEE